MANDLTQEQEQKLEEREERMRAAIAQLLASNRQQAADLESVARGLRDQVDAVIAAVTRGRWYDLKGVIADADIESLCEIEPTDRVGTFLPESD